MLKIMLQGLLFGIAYAAPIGPQNLYVINTAVRRRRLEASLTALITVFFDISLAVACFFGIGFLVDKFSVLKEIILLAGSVMVAYIGIGLIRSSSKTIDDKNIDYSIIKTVINCFAVTWLNPQAIIDGSLLLGGFKASLPPEMSGFFIAGVCTASFLWFNSLTAFAARLRHRLDKIIKWINVSCGIILIFYGFKLAYSFIKLVFY